ncbi:MAG: SGNH/GDSL hydrolase family protein [Prevotellaceae bacterium]|jgi:lysophospholipase L1-like esterase|nr:SGNH/GDSL hydrolase family protein [Prevotellaceae bacterium]
MKRRQFLSTAGWAAVGAAAVPGVLLANCSKKADNPDTPDTPEPPEPPGPDYGEPARDFRFVFQGDSVTESGRDKSAVVDDKNSWGYGYVSIIGNLLVNDFPRHRLGIFNRGWGGNATWDLFPRWKRDTLDLNADLLSLLIGVNHTIMDGAGTIAGFGGDIRNLVQQCRDQNPDMIIVLGLPFMLPMGPYESTYETNYRPDLEARCNAIRELAPEFDALVVDFLTMFEEAGKSKPYSYYLADGVHPTAAGHELMAKEWMRVVGERLPYFKKYVQ